jgi:hypothetical protein
MPFDKSVVETYVTQESDIVRTNGRKDKQYYLDNAVGMFSIHVRSCGGISYSEQGRYQILRDYSNGKQSESTYTNYFASDTKHDSPVAERVSDVDGKGGFVDQKENKREGYFNVLWKVISPAPKVIATLLGKFESAEYDIKANPIDANSGAEVENKMLELWAMKENMEFLRTFNSNMGVETQEPDFMPETIDELKLFRDRGGFKAEHAMFMEQLIRWTLFVSRWKEIKKDMTKDIIDLSFACCHDYYDREDNTVKTEYVDPEMFGIQYSDYNDFRDSEHAFVGKEMTISQIRYLLQEEGIPKDVYEPQLQKCARAYCGKYGNPFERDINDFGTPNEMGGWKYDYFKVLVTDNWWVDTDETKDLISTTRYGKKKIYHNFDGEPKEGQELLSTCVRKGFICSWLVGSEIIFNYGVAQNITRNKKDVISPFHAYKFPWTSITDQLIPIYDNFAIIWYKYQNAIATAVNRGVAIDWDTLVSLETGGKSTIKEALKLYFQTGNIIYKRTNSRGRQESNQLPVQELKGGMGEAVNDAFLQFKLNFQMIETLTGINPLSLGTVDPNAPVKTNEIAVAATSDTLRPILSGILSLKESMAKNTCFTIQTLLKYDEDAQKTYSEIIGSRGIEIMQIANGNAVKYGIALEAKPSEQEKADLKNKTEVALQAGRNGQPGITLADAFAVSRILEYGGSLQLAEMMLETSIRKNKEAIAKQAQQNAQAQTQGQMQMEQAKVQIQSQADIALVQEKGKQERETLTTKAFYDALLLQDKANADATIKAIEGYIKGGQMYLPPLPQDNQQAPQGGQQGQPQGQPAPPQQQEQPQMQGQ